MREILFRGKRIDNGEWVYGNLNYGTIEIESIKDSYFISDLNVTPWDKKFYSVISETVGQYTGLTDKNGKKIFEGDIVKYFRYGNHGDSRVAYVTYSCKDTAYQLSDGKTVCMNIGAWFYSDELEVIGNIHDDFELLDNPELLEDKP